MAAGDLCDINAVKQWLFAGGQSAPSSDDELLQTLVTAVSGFIEKWLNRTLASTTYTEVRNGTNSARLMLKNYPISAVSALSINGQAVPASPTTPFGQPGYMFDEKSIMLRGYWFCQGFQNISITYTAGFVTIPPEIVRAAVELVGVRYKEYNRIGVSSQTIGAQTTAFSQKDMPADVLTILSNYQKVISL